MYRGQDSERGAASVELALVLPLLITVLFGLFGAGLAYNEKLDLTYAAREGVRYGSVVAPSQTWASGTWATNVRDVVVAHSEQGLTAADVCVSLVINTSTTATAVYSQTGFAASSFTTKADGTPCTQEGYPQWSTTDNGRRVQVTVTRPVAIDLVLLPTINLSVKSSAVARHEVQS